jgi:hypothetical protein
MHEGFREGDHIEVTTQEKWKGTFRDFGTLRGTAMDTRGLTGMASFRLWMNAPGNNNTVQLDLNYVDVRVLFVPDVARGDVTA